MTKNGITLKNIYIFDIYMTKNGITFKKIYI